MKKNTLITTELISKGDNTVQDDVRKQEYNMNNSENYSERIKRK